MAKSRTPAQKAADKAIEQAGKAAKEKWMTAAQAAIVHVALKSDFFTTDDVWSVLKDPPNISVFGDIPADVEPRAMGAAMRIACRAGVCEPTKRYQESSRVACHARPLRVWKSLR